MAYIGEQVLETVLSKRSQILLKIDVIQQV